MPKQRPSCEDPDAAHSDLRQNPLPYFLSHATQIVKSPAEPELGMETMLWGNCDICGSTVVREVPVGEKLTI